MSRATGQVPVIAHCTAGHTTRAVSDPGRLTWEGICAEAGCGLKVKGKRAPADALGPLDDAVPVPEDDDDRYRVREVTAYRDDRSRATTQPADEPAAAAGEGDEPAARAAPRRRNNSGTPAPPTVPETVAPTPIRRGAFDRVREWFTADDDVDDDHDDIVGW